MKKRPTLPVSLHEICGKSFSAPLNTAFTGDIFVAQMPP
jgi:hypothetical protein